MKLAVVKTSSAAVYGAPEERGARRDELLLGMTAEVLEDRGDWLRVRTSWQQEGYVQAALLHADEKAAAEWSSYGKLAARAPFVDVLEKADSVSAVLACLPRGGLVHPVGEEEDENGFWEVALPDGRRGFAKVGNLMPQMLDTKASKESSLREALATTALSYLGAQYRKGGRTMMGIDAPGLVGMACLLNGLTLPYGVDFEEGGILRKIMPEELGMGDVLYFEGHVALYLGDDNYVHATDKDGSDGVVINSLRPVSPFYREDLSAKLTTCASFFWGSALRRRPPGI